MAHMNETERPAENTKTAARSNVNKEEICVPGFVPRPKLTEVVEAKEYADRNEKSI